MSLIWVALVMGLTGGLHCAAMCGPIAMSIPGQKWSSALLYNVGRSLTYFMLGVTVALVGLPVKWLVGSQWFSIIIGGLIVIVALYSVIGKKIVSGRGMVRIRIRNTLKRVWNVSPFWSPLLIGMLNGLLPCGLLYMALVASAGMDNPALSGIFMLVFSLATWPALLLIWLFGNRVKSLLGKNRIWLSFAFTVLFGLFIMFRGMNLGIPVVSPHISQSDNCTKIECCSR